MDRLRLANLARTAVWTILPAALVASCRLTESLDGFTNGEGETGNGGSGVTGGVGGQGTGGMGGANDGGTGGTYTVHCTTDSQCPQDACNRGVCIGQTCSLNPKPQGTPCPNGVCNGAGSCVQCGDDAGSCVQCADDIECPQDACNRGV